MFWIPATVGLFLFVAVLLAGIIGPRPGMPWSLPADGKSAKPAKPEAAPKG